MADLALAIFVSFIGMVLSWHIGIRCSDDAAVQQWAMLYRWCELLFFTCLALLIAAALVVIFFEN